MTGIRSTRTPSIGLKERLDGIETAAAVQAGASREVLGAAAVAETFAGRARAAHPALVNGAAGLIWAPGGRPRVVFDFTIERGKIVEIELLADAARVRRLDLEILKG